VTLTKVAIFAVGYVVGTKAGHERYAQIVEFAGRASQRLEEYSARHGGRGADSRRD
jgi:hypothetical protein